MKTPALGLALALLLAGLPALQAPRDPQRYEPTRGQDGKDVVWGPTSPAQVAAMLDMAGVGPGDTVIDLGSGDGRIVIAAATRGARGIGLEYNADLVALARRLAQDAGVADRTSFTQADIFAADFGEATVLTLYLMTDLNLRLRPKILGMRPGTRVVSNSFGMKDWKADQQKVVDGRPIYSWIVPARAAGTWTWTLDAGEARLTLQQRFQTITGRVTIAGANRSIRNATLSGRRIRFSAGTNTATSMAFAGVIDDDAIDGQVTRSGGAEAPWHARRVSTR